MPIPYEAPIGLMRLALDQACSASGTNAIDGYAQTLAELATPILESASRFAGDVLSPLNPVGDRAHSRCGPEGVVTPPGFREAYRRFREDGWVSLSAPTEYGGQGLPGMLAVATGEMWAGANMAFAMCPELAVGALEAMRVHAPEAVRNEYMPLIASGEWTTSMCLTEPQAGSDLSTIRTRAEPDGETWRLFGRKIYISWGDHDLADNIVHFVLARTPDAPAGTKGISLFLVPKRIPSADGTLTPNDIHAVSVESKMGIRASPTCVMALGEGAGARGWLIGKLHEGLACMFTIMNHMRIGVGTHSIGLAERGLQLARHHARERLQGRDQSGAQRPIIEHADVRRMLLTMKSLTHAARCLTYTAAATVDVAHSAADPDTRAAAARRAELLTPIVKAWVSDVGFEVASLGVQVHGGTGYIDDAEISQVFRDSRIGSIFEGTNYIQAQDLVGRKILRDRGVTLGEFLSDVTAAAHALPADPAHPLRLLREGLIEGCADIHALTTTLTSAAPADRELVGSVAYDYLNCLGVLAGGWQWALTAAQAISANTGTEGSGSLPLTAAFYGARVLPRIKVYAAAVRTGSTPVIGVATADL